MRDANYTQFGIIGGKLYTMWKVGIYIALKVPLCMHYIYTVPTLRMRTRGSLHQLEVN